MMMISNTTDNLFTNIASMMAEDSGAPELRNPLNSGMRAKGFFSRLFSRKPKEREGDRKALAI
jgi:hypothetical protein